MRGQAMAKSFKQASQKHPLLLQVLSVIIPIVLAFIGGLLTMMPFIG